MVVSRGDIWWADLPEPAGSEPGFRRPVVVVQSDKLNVSRLATVVVIPCSANTKWAAAPGNVLYSKEQTGLPKDSVAVAAQILTVDRSWLVSRVGQLRGPDLDRLLSGLDIVVGRV